MVTNNIYTEKVDAFLIDDDNEVHYIWDQFARIGNGRYVGFYSSVDFFKNVDLLDRSVPVYIDSGLKEEIPGELIAKAIKTLGFKTIYLQTTEPISEDLSQMDWLTGVLGKDTPWDHLVGLKRAEDE